MSKVVGVEAFVVQVDYFSGFLVAAFFVANFNGFEFLDFVAKFVESRVA